MTPSQTLSQVYADLLDGQVERLLSEQQPDGAFQAPGAPYSIYEQNAIYPLTLAYLRPGGRYEGDTRLLDAIQRSGDRHRQQLNDEGKWEVITPGGRWGWSFDEWRLHFWLETALLLGERLDAARLAQWDEGIVRAAGGIVALTRERLAEGLIDFVEGVCVTSPNHMAWYALVCRRAGIRYGRTDWVELADDLFAQMRAAQTPDGFWVEFAAPSVGYNYITLLAVGVYREHLWPDAPPEWMECIERGMDAQLQWSYPDGGIVGEIEGRQRYHGPSDHVLPALCARWPRGAASLRESAQRLASLSSHQRLPHLAFLSETARYLERHEQKDEGGRACPERSEGMKDEGKATKPSSFILHPSAFHKAQAFEAGWRRAGPWQATLCGLVTQRYESRWRLDIANFVGLYHEAYGLLAGGGHSKDDPEWATFTVRLSEGADPVWLPSRAEVTQGEAEDSLTLHYGEVPARVRVSFASEGATIRFDLLRPTAGCSAVARLLRPLAPGVEVTGPDGDTLTLNPDEPIAWRLTDGGEIRIGSVCYVLPPGGAFRWPRLPFNPYNQQNASAPGEAFAAFEAPLDAARPQAELRVTESGLCAN